MKIKGPTPPLGKYRNKGLKMPHFRAAWFIPLALAGCILGGGEGENGITGTWVRETIPGILSSSVADKKTYAFMDSNRVGFKLDIEGIPTSSYEGDWSLSSDTIRIHPKKCYFKDSTGVLAYSEKCPGPSTGEILLYWDGRRVYDRHESNGFKLYYKRSDP